MIVPAPTILDSADSDLAAFAAALPTSAGVLCLEVEGRVTHLSSAPNLQRRVERILQKITGKKLAEQVAQIQPQERRWKIHCWQSGTKLHTALLLYELAKVHFPDDYLQRVHLRMPWFVALLTSDPFPRVTYGNRLPHGCTPVLGPFARRDLAQLYAQEIEGAFLLRRCTEVLQPDPEHPGCIYGEMKQCLRPCQRAVGEAQYLAEAASVSAVLRDGGGKSVRELAKRRDQATAELEFETAARLHKQVERLKSGQGARDPVITDIDLLNGVVIVLAKSGEEVEVFPIAGGIWRTPVSLELTPEAELAGLEDKLRHALAGKCWEDEVHGRNQLEDLALFARWYYSSWREGVWLAFPRWDDLPYRKLARALQKLLKPPNGGASLVPAAEA